MRLLVDGVIVNLRESGCGGLVVFYRVCCFVLCLCVALFC